MYSNFVDRSVCWQRFVLIWGRFPDYLLLLMMPKLNHFDDLDCITILTVLMILIVELVLEGSEVTVLE